jgi:hypothetical protein
VYRLMSALAMLLAIAEPSVSAGKDAPAAAPTETLTAFDSGAPPSGRITFVGAIVVGTAETPAVTTTSSATGAQATVRTGRFSAPARVVTSTARVRRQLLEQLKRLELPGEQIGQPQVAVVSYM